MTKKVLEPALWLMQQLSELEVQLRAVDRTDNQGEPCQYCEVHGHVNMVTLHGFGSDGERGTADCCVYCVPAVVAEWFNPMYATVAEVAR